ncbi:hypothetical protein [Vibrio rarus]|uniref:hypothetical protein n=1 Tax=Vibrio rarus TaxID=413403 RepID=UPI0021C28299|nr:hypothetical protein [Vibrio rarus]
MTCGTPKDYTEALYKVYFEVGEWQGSALQVLSQLVGQTHANTIKHLEFGYELAMPIQCIPDAVKRLADNNIAVYQVVRGSKVTGA